MLIQKAETIVKEQHKDINIIRLFSGEQRKKAHKLYEHLGYNGKDYKAYYKKIKNIAIFNVMSIIW